MASRHLSRMAAVQALFAADMTGPLTALRVRESLDPSIGMPTKGQDQAFTDALIAGVTAKQPEIDAVIVKAAPDWPIDRVAPLDRAVLRLGLYELLYGDPQDVPPRVALDEAIELAKTFGGEASAGFINGVLDGVYKEIKNGKV